MSNGYKLVETAGQTMQEIVSSTQQVASIMTEISQASEEQRTGILQLNNAISSMDETTQQNAALVEELSAAARSLQDQARQQVRTIGVFTLAGEAGRSPAHADPAHAPAGHAAHAAPGHLSLRPAQPLLAA